MDYANDPELNGEFEQNYKAIILRFISQETNVDTFVDEFIARWKIDRDTDILDNKFRRMIDRLFTSCDCYDAQGGNVCKHIHAVQQDAHALTAYAVSWDHWASTYLPCCPECGAVIEQRQYWVGGVGWLWFKVCTHDGSHYGERA